MFIFLAVAITAINRANPSIVHLAFAITRLAQGAWAAAVAVCVVVVISNSSRVVLNAAVGLASLVTLMALFFVTWNLGELLKYRPPKTQLVAPG